MFYADRKKRDSEVTSHSNFSCVLFSMVFTSRFSGKTVAFTQQCNNKKSLISWEGALSSAAVHPVGFFFNYVFYLFHSRGWRR